MDLIAWLIFGTIIGSLSFVLDPRPNNGGLLGSMIVGGLGGLAGGFLGDVIFGLGLGGFSFLSLSISVIFTVLLLFAVRVAQKHEET